MARRESRAAENRGGGEGYALLVALLALVALSAMATGGLWVARSTSSMSDAFSKGRRAYYAAGAGLQEFVGTYGLNPPPSATYDLGDGKSAAVRAVALHRVPDVYHVEATGRLEEDGEVVATRSVGATASVNMGPLPAPPGSLFSPGGVLQTGGQGMISGLDRFTPSEPGQCPYLREDDTYGVVVSRSGRYRGNPHVPTGDPSGILRADRQEMLDELDLDWASVLDGSAVQPDVTVDPDDMSTWPDFDTIADDRWLLIQAKGRDKTLSLGTGDGGHGLLVAEGDLTLSGSFEWKGVVYAGGAVTTGSGLQSVRGGVLSGLNHLVGDPPADADLFDGPVSFRYHSCHVRQARGAASRLQIVPGTWYEGEGSAP